MAGLSLLRVVDNATLDRMDSEAARRAALLEQRQNDPLITGLSAYLRRAWDAAKKAKQPIEDAMLRSLRQRTGEYEPGKLAEIRKQGGSEVYMMITEVKCRAAESWLRDILLDDGSPPWALSPTPLPALPPGEEESVAAGIARRVVAQVQALGTAPSPDDMREIRTLALQERKLAIMQEAQARADRMKTLIEDQFQQGGWPAAFNEFLTDVVTYPAAFLKGPVVRRQRTLGYTTAADGSTTVRMVERLGPEFERVDPFNIYPEPGISRLRDGYLFEVHRLSRSDLAELVGVPGYDAEAVRRLLEVGNGASWVQRPLATEQADEERRHHADDTPTDTYDALEFWGKISGRMLREWGLSDAEVPDEDREYDANAWVVGDYVIKATLNYDPLGEKPYAKTSFIKLPGAFWGRGIPEIVADLQGICNAAARGLVNNMGVASGPQVEVNLDRIPADEDITQMHPWKIWQTMNDPLGSSAPAIRFTQPESRARELMEVYDRFSRLADDHSGIPAYIYGDLNVQGAGRTASGLSMLMGSAGKGIRQIVMHIDNDIVQPIVQRQFVYNMRYSTDNTIKGDAQVVPRGAVSLAVKETVDVRRVEFLNATANPVDMEIVGKDGRAALLREVAKGLQMPVDDIVPSREKMAQQKGQPQVQQAQAQPQQGQALLPGGDPRGGQAANTVMNRATGGAG